MVKICQSGLQCGVCTQHGVVRLDDSKHASSTCSEAWAAAEEYLAAQVFRVPEQLHATPLQSPMPCPDQDL
jgi:hypothetical protein